jgi:DNA-binding transcriptional MocR family regulator
LTQSSIKSNIVTMTMWAPDVARRSGPRYLAIAEALAEDTASGRLLPGTRLPTHRELADHLGVTVGTVTRAYAEASRRGLVSGEVGRGTFARGPAAEFAPLRGVAARGEGPAIDLSVNLPPSVADEERSTSLRRTLAALSRRKDLGTLLSYPPDGGSVGHRAAGAAWIRRAGLEATPDNVLVSSGSQHGMTAVFGGLLRPGDLVLTESLTYPGMKALASLLHLRLQGLPMDEHGLRPEALEAACRTAGAKALYCIPTLQNPTAAVMPEERRREIAGIARERGLLVVEDDVHGLVPEKPPRPLAAFLPEQTIYLTGTAKSLAPGLRIGFVLAPEALIPRLAGAIRTTTWMAAPLMAEIAALWIKDGSADAILKRKRKEAAARHRLALGILDGQRLGAHPAAYHLWLHLPEPWRSETFVEAARRRGVAVTPAQAFVVGRSATPDAVRVCLGAARDRTQLEAGLRTLADILGEAPEAGFAFV